MNQQAPFQRRVQARVDQVLPQTGLAFVVDEGARCWGITRSTRGAGLEQLQAGQTVVLAIAQHDDIEVVTDYAPLGD